MGAYYIWGGDGFVGRYLAASLMEINQKVVICDVKKTENDPIYKVAKYVKADICNFSQVDALPIEKNDIVINMAANQYHKKVPRNRKEYFFSVNYVGTKNVLKSIYTKGCKKYLMFSTDMSYGKPQYLPIDTKHPQNPFGPYGESKLACENLCRKYREKGINITIMRPRMIIGPGRMGILAKMFKLVDWNLPVPTIGNGKNHYQMISVFDCVSAVLSAIDKGFPNKEYNLGSKNAPCTKDLLKGVIETAHSHSLVLATPGKLIKMILKLMDNCGLTLMYPEQFMIADEEYILDIKDTEKDLDWHPLYNDSDMIKQAYEIYKLKVS
jgi:nucleoside-diphosphate-sugar epimerase